VRWLAGAFVALAVLTVAAGAPFAEHEVSFRYTVLGYVKDGAGKPLAGRPVKVVRNKTGLAYTAETDEGGLYVLVLRLGDESAGEALTLEIGGAHRPLTARFDPKNQVDERGTRVDLEGARWLERPAWFASTRARALTRPAH
jgi:hypothetical protein